MPVKTEIVKCLACESTSFQVHRSGGYVKFVCVHCGEEVPDPAPDDEDFNWGGVNAEIAQ